MSIDWFPGHMATARREAEQTLRSVDVVIEVLDARVPQASRSPMIAQLRQAVARPALALLNKSDLADAAQTTRWLAHLRAQPDTAALAISTKDASSLQAIVPACARLAPSRGSVLKPLRMLILGIPNVGKSTLMNALLHRRVAPVGDEPAVTRHQMKHALRPGQILVDSPGMLWPHVDQDTALLLCMTHSIGRNAYDEETVATALGTRLLQRAKPRLIARYGDDVASCTDGHALLQHIVRARHIVADPMGRAATLLLDEFRSGTLGRITLQTVDDVTGHPAT